MASEPDWDSIADQVEAMADEAGMDVDGFVELICRYRRLIRVLLTLCEG